LRRRVSRSDLDLIGSGLGLVSLQMLKFPVVFSAYEKIEYSGV
jgi:hypothetical protein